MADLEAVLADVSYLMAMERSKTPAAKTIKKLTLPDARCGSFFVGVAALCLLIRGLCGRL